LALLVAERRRGIVDIVDRQGSVRVTELAGVFQVREETIRRDLEQLELERKLVRSHGGAVTVRDWQQEVPYHEREVVHVEEKMAIATEVVRQIARGDRIILDASSTALQVAKLLPDQPLTVVTNAIKVALELASKPSIQVLSTGGLLLTRSLSFVGPLAERSLSEYRVNKAFLSCKGCSLSRGLSESNELQAEVKKAMIAIADETFLLLDYSKFHAEALVMFAPWVSVQTVVTDNATPTDTIEALKEQGLRVTVAHR